MPEDVLVFVETCFNKVDSKLLVEDLSTGGALLICPDLSESLQTGQSLGACTLHFPGGSVPVDVTVRWQLWPRVGVQFSGVSSRDLTKISKFLDSSTVKPV